MRLRHQDSLQTGGSWMQSRGGWHGVVGDHGLAWGHGLTVPRADMFGLALFLGDAEMRMHNPPRGLIHSDFEGGLRGLALERQSRMTKVGVTLGTGHLGALVMSTFRQQEWGWTLYKTGGVSFGPHWTARIRRHAHPMRGCLFNDGTMALQSVLALGAFEILGDTSGLGHGATRRTVDGVVSRLRHLDGPAIWERPAGSLAPKRASNVGRPSQGCSVKHAFLNWSFVGDGQSTLLGDSRHDRGIALHVVAGSQHHMVVVTGASCGMRLAHE